VSEVRRVEVAEPAPGQTVAFEVGDQKILLCNVDGELHAVENQCSHARMALTEAKLVGNEIECPVHGARFDARTGIAMCRPARRPLRTFAVRRVDDGLEISLD